MADAILLRNLPEGLGEVYVWKKYELVENVSYKWNRYDVVTTVTYKWEKWSRDVEWKAELSAPFPSYNKMLPGGFILYDEMGCNSTTGKLYVGGKSWILMDTIGVSNAGGKYFKEGDYVYSGNYTSTWYPDDGNTGSTTGRVYEFSCLRYESVNVRDEKGDTSYGQVASTNPSAYPSNGASGSYWYVSAGSDTSYSKGSTSYPDVSSASNSAYPNPGHQDGYWYENRQEVITYSIGSYIEDVFSTNPQRYPTNGIDGAYWYVLQS